MDPHKSLSDRTIALVAVVSVFTIATLIAFTIFLRRRSQRLQSHSQPDTESSSSNSISPPIKLSQRKQTHADRKVFSWFEKVDEGAEMQGEGGFRMSMLGPGRGRMSAWKMSEEEMKELSEELDRLRGRESVMTGAGRLSLMAPAMMSGVS